MNDLAPYHPISVGKRIRQLREAAGMRQVDFAERVGTDQRALSNWESGRQRPAIDVAARICEAFSVDLNWLLLGDPSFLRYEVATRLLDKNGSEQARRQH